MSGGRIDWAAVRRRLAEGEAGIERSLAPDGARLQALLRRRAARLAERRLDAVVEPTVEILGFQLGAEWCGLPLTVVAEVQPFRRCTPVPGLVPEVLGVINLRGQIRPVLDLRRLVGAKPADGEAEGYILFLRDGAGLLGARVDGMSAVRRIRLDEIAPPGGGDAELGGRFAHGIAPDGQVLLDAPTVVEALAEILRPAA